MRFVGNDRNLEHVRKMLPDPAMALWCEAANDAVDQGADHNAAVLAGWDAVKADGWTRPAKGKRWVKSMSGNGPGVTINVNLAKDDPGSADVHVPVPLGSERTPRKKKPPVVDGYDSTDDEVDEIDASRLTQKSLYCEVKKIDDALGVVMGWAIVCMKDGKPYFDLQDDHIPEDAMLKSAADFMQSDRISGDMHARDETGAPIQDGSTVFMFPLTADIAKSLGIECTQTGLLIGIKPSADVLRKFKDGSYTGFSIGGHRVKDEAVRD